MVKVGAEFKVHGVIFEVIGLTNGLPQNRGMDVIVSYKKKSANCPNLPASSGIAPLISFKKAVGLL